MFRKLTFAIALAALTSPALAQDHAYEYQDESGRAYSDDPAPPGQGSYAEYPADPGPQVDVNVDLATPGATVTFDTFHDGLAAQGEWITSASYGRVWRPRGVAASWRPYYYGRWEWTDEGWLWVSDEPWGWATYHYGRWAFEPGFGWVWLPGYQWAPAWVTWRYSPEYIGWAPLGPGFSVYVTSYPVNYFWWSFVPCRRFVGYPVYQVAYTGGYVRGIFHATQPAPPRAHSYGVVAPAWGGPARPFIEQRVGRPVTPVRVQPVASPAAVAAAPARGGVVPVYRPEHPVGARPGAASPAPGRAPGTAMAPGAGRPSAPAPGVAPARPWSGGGAPGARPAPSTPAPVQGPRGGAAPARPQAPSPGWRSERPGPAPAGPPRAYGAPRPSAPAPAAPRMSAPGAPRMSAPVAPRAAPAPRGGGVGGGGGGHGGHAAPAPQHR